MSNKERHARLVDPEMVEKISVYLRTNVPVKSRQLGPRGKHVNYFSGKRMIDFLMKSPFSVEKDEEDGVIETRADCITIAKIMMNERRFYRGSFGEKKVKKKDGTIKTKKIVYHISQNSYNPNYFVDEDQPFIWTYDPVTRTTIFYGLLLLAGVCMCVALPLWPNWLRNIVIGFLLFILIGRPAIWLAVYLVTFSRWNFMILPHLDDDISFNKRFEPLWSLERSATASGANEDDEDEDEDGAEQDGENDQEDEEEDGNGADENDSDTDNSNNKNSKG